MESVLLEHAHQCHTSEPIVHRPLPPCRAMPCRAVPLQCNAVPCHAVQCVAVRIADFLWRGLAGNEPLDLLVLKLIKAQAKFMVREYSLSMAAAAHIRDGGGTLPFPFVEPSAYLSDVAMCRRRRCGSRQHVCHATLSAAPRRMRRRRLRLLHPPAGTCRRASGSRPTLLSSRRSGRVCASTSAATGLAPSRPLRSVQRVPCEYYRVPHVSTTEYPM